MDPRIFHLLTEMKGRVSFLRESIQSLRQAVTDVETKLRELATARSGERRTRLRNRRVEALRLLATLSPRQRDVLERVMAGQSNKEMAFELGVSEKTIETHRARLMQKLHATTLPKLIETALLGGFPQPSLRHDTRRDETNWAAQTAARTIVAHRGHRDSTTDRRSRQRHRSIRTIHSSIRES